MYRPTFKEEVILPPTTVGWNTVLPPWPTEDKSKKSRWDLLRFGVINMIGEVMAAGEGKHKDTNGWAKLSVDHHFAAAMRHIAAWRTGEQYDTGEGGIGTHHLVNALCRLMFIVAIETGDVPDVED